MTKKYTKWKVQYCVNGRKYFENLRKCCISLTKCIILETAQK